jgi:hypothetical protein
VYQPPRGEARAALAEVYRGVDAALAPVASACRACGKCCHFEPGGIILFASAVELAYLVAETPAVSATAQLKPSRGGSPDPPRERRGYGLGNAACAVGPETHRAKSESCSCGAKCSSAGAGAPDLTVGARKRRADDSWCCPYQRDKRCTARGARLLGCRTYFCDAKAREVGEGVYAEALGEIQRIAAGQGAWWYGPARVYLEHV